MLAICPHKRPQYMAVSSHGHDICPTADASIQGTNIERNKTSLECWSFSKKSGRNPANKLPRHWPNKPPGVATLQWEGADDKASEVTPTNEVAGLGNRRVTAKSRGQHSGDKQKDKMKTKLKFITLLAAALGMCGCNTVAPLLTPAALTSEVATGVRVGLDVYPAAAPGVAMARDSICGLALSTNTSPAAIVADLQALGVTDSNTKLIVDAALLLYEGVYDLIGTNNTSKVQPYTQALCDGLTQGLPGAGVARKAMMQPILPPHWK